MAKSHYLHYVTSNNSPIVVILSISMINEGSKFDPLGIFSLLKTMKGTISYLGDTKVKKNKFVVLEFFFSYLKIHDDHSRP